MSESGKLASALFFTWLAYVVCYLCRKCFAVAKAELEREASISVSTLALCDSAFLVNYALGQIIFVPAVSKFQPHTVLACALLASAVCCAAIPAAVHNMIGLVLALWALHGLMQSVIHPIIIQLLTSLMVGDPRKGLYMGIWSTSQSVGGVLGILLASWSISAGHGWQAAFWAPVIPSSMTAAVLALQGCALCQNRGVPEKDGNDQDSVSAKDNQGSMQVSFSVRRMVQVPGVMRLMVSFFLVKFLRYAMLLWLPYYHTLILGHSDAVAARLATAFEVGGALGALLFGWVSDALGSRLGGPDTARMRLSAVCLFAASALFGCYPAIAKNHAGTGYALMLLIGVTVEGPESGMSSSMLADISSKSNIVGPDLARLAGLVNGVGIAGASCTGLSMRFETGETRHQGRFFLLLAFASLLSGAVLERYRPYMRMITSVRI